MEYPGFFPLAPAGRPISIISSTCPISSCGLPPFSHNTKVQPHAGYTPLPLTHTAFRQLPTRDVAHNAAHAALPLPQNPPSRLAPLAGLPPQVQGYRPQRLSTDGPAHADQARDDGTFR